MLDNLVYKELLEKSMEIGYLFLVEAPGFSGDTGDESERSRNPAGRCWLPVPAGSPLFRRAFLGRRIVLNRPYHAGAGAPDGSSSFSPTSAR